MNSPAEEPTIVPGSLRVNGVVQAKAFLQFSDIRLKTDFADIVDAIDILSQIEGKSFVWKNEELNTLTGGKRVIGLIAQQVQKVVPEVVKEDPVTGYLAVSYAELIPIVIEAFKQHMRQYQSDKQEVNKQIEDLKEKIEALETKTQGLIFFFFPTSSLIYQTAEAEMLTQDQKGPAGEIPLIAPPPKQKENIITKYYKKIPLPVLRIAILLTFFIALAIITFGAVLLGITISHQGNQLSTSGKSFFFFFFCLISIKLNFFQFWELIH